MTSSARSWNSCVSNWSNHKPTKPAPVRPSVRWSRNWRLPRRAPAEQAVEHQAEQAHGDGADENQQPALVALSGGELVCTCEASPHNLVDILDTLRAADVALGRVWSEPPTLHDVFPEITGRELRD